jgi:hypothetical protein
MPIEWSGLSPELILPLDRERPEPLRSQLETGLREAARSFAVQARQLGVDPELALRQAQRALDALAPHPGEA